MKPDLNVKERSTFLFLFLVISFLNLGFQYFPVFPSEAYQFDNTNQLGTRNLNGMDYDFLYREKLVINPNSDRFLGTLEFGVDGNLLDDYESDNALSYYRISSLVYNVSVSINVNINGIEIANIDIIKSGSSKKNILDTTNFRFYVGVEEMENQPFNNNIYPFSNGITIEYKFNFQILNVTSVEPNTVFSIITTETIASLFYETTSDKTLVKSTIPLIVLLFFNILFFYFVFKLLKKFEYEEELTKGELQFSIIIIPNLMMTVPLLPLILRYAPVLDPKILWITGFIIIGLIPMIFELKYKNYYYKGVNTGNGKLQNNYYFANTTNVRLLPSFTKRDTEGMDVDNSFNELFLGKKIARFHSKLPSYIFRRVLLVMLIMIVLFFFIAFLTLFLPILYWTYIAIRRVEMNL